MGTARVAGRQQPGHQLGRVRQHRVAHSGRFQRLCEPRLERGGSTAAAHTDRPQRKGHGGQIPRIGLSSHRKSRPDAQSLGPQESFMHRNQVRRLELQRPRHDGQLVHHQRAL
uniref:(northern house mosquito) hypothetical protein n=1 Tax=Culex pipiens TaxID=7175 RepID=A0A8D8CHE0_CULPI